MSSWTNVEEGVRCEVSNHVATFGMRIRPICDVLVAAPRYPAQLSGGGMEETSAPAISGGRVNSMYDGSSSGAYCTPLPEEPAPGPAPQGLPSERATGPAGGSPGPGIAVGGCGFGIRLRLEQSTPLPVVRSTARTVGNGVFFGPPAPPWLYPGKAL